MNKKHIPGATMSGITNLRNYCMFYEGKTNKLDFLMSKSCKQKKIDFYIGSGLNIQINRYNNQNHTWKLKKLRSKFRII